MVVICDSYAKVIIKFYITTPTSYFILGDNKIKYGFEDKTFRKPQKKVGTKPTPPFTNTH